MAISNVGGDISTRYAKDISAVVKASASSASASAQRADGDGDDTASVSGPGALLDKLRSLKDSDPKKFQEVMAKLSQSISKEAASSTDPAQKKALTDLASKFDTAAKTGDLSALAPPAGGRAHKGGGGHHAERAGSAGSKAATAADPADKNQDGTVSASEKQAYAAAQAAKQAAASGKSPYASNDAHAAALTTALGIAEGIV